MPLDYARLAQLAKEFEEVVNTGDNSYEAHYEEKVTTASDTLHGRDYLWHDPMDVAYSYTDDFEESQGPQTSLQSRTLTNRKKEKAWKRSRKKHLPRWMRG